jgi:hypothetical protein
MSCKNLSHENCNPPNCKYINGPKRKYCRKNTVNNATKKVSVCKGLAKNNCFKPCKYIETDKRQYCRISGKKIVEKVEKAKNTIRRFLTKALRKRKLNKTQSISREKSTSLDEKKLKRQKQIEKVSKAKQTISNFLYKNKEKIKANYLKIKCSDSGVCITFGKETKKINDFFMFFHNFDYMIRYTNLTAGMNGSIIKIDYEREKYKSYAILKKVLKASSDSLMYEYIVGHFFINNVYRKFPSFLQTYGFVNSGSLDLLKEQKVLNLTEANLNDGLKLSCINPSKILLLLENVEKPISLFSKLIRNEKPFIEEELLNILFQVYYTLHILKDLYTHYDLHSDNILLYEPIENSYIEYHYHFQREVITFKSRYIAKIIDYGRSFFRNSTIQSNDIYRELCKIKECNNGEKCGDMSGYSFFLKSQSEIKTNHYINSLSINNSHDLRLIKDVMRLITTKSLSPAVNKYLLFFKKNTNYEQQFGTPHNPSSGLPKKINNVSDAFQFIKNTKLTIVESLSFDHLDKIGDLHVYDDGRDMEFIGELN